MKIKLPEKDRTPKHKTPWLIEVIINGIKAQNVRDSKVLGFKPVAGVPVKYFEFDRIFGKNAFRSVGIMKVTDLFEELNDETPHTIGYIFKDHNYIRRPDGIKKQSRKDGSELFFSNETLQNNAAANFFELDYETDNPESEIHSEEPEQQSPPDPDQRGLLP